MWASAPTRVLVKSVNLIKTARRYRKDVANMNFEIISVGTELLLGQIVNTVF